VKTYIENPSFAPSDPAWQRYRAHWFRCGEPSDDEALVTIAVNDSGLATVHCR
jgi:hypothetical protein